MSNLKISVFKKEYNSYSDLVKFIKGKFSRKINVNSSCKEEIIGLLKTFTDMLVKGKNRDIYLCLVKEEVQYDIVYHLQLYINIPDVELLRAMLSYLITITDNSESMCEAFTNTELPSILINTFIRVCSKDIQLQFSKDVTSEDISLQLRLVMYYIMRHERYQQVFRQHNDIKEFKGQLLVYLSDKRTTILSMALLTWLTEDDDHDKSVLGRHSYIIENFTDHITKCMKNNGHFNDALCAWELLLVLQSLSRIDSIEHSFFLTEKFMKMISNVLESKTSLPQEINIALMILLNLSFIDNNLEKMMKDFKMDAPIKVLMHHSDEKIKKKALELHGKLSNNRETVYKYDVFISYCHAEKEIVKKLVEELKKTFKVWVDSEGGEGSVMDDMARGIETSQIFLMVVSHSYKQSQCCRSEANWAYELKKPMIPLLMVRKYKPDGWLGMMISTETYIDVSDVHNIETSIQEIKKHILHKCINLVPNKNVTPKEEPTMGVTKDLTNTAKRDWTKSDVTAWLVANDMSDMVSLLDKFDGGRLVALKNMKNFCPADFNTHAKVNLGLSFTQILKLDAAISRLD